MCPNRASAVAGSVGRFCFTWVSVLLHIAVPPHPGTVCFTFVRSARPPGGGERPDSDMKRHDNPRRCGYSYHAARTPPRVGGRSNERADQCDQGSASHEAPHTTEADLILGLPSDGASAPILSVARTQGRRASPAR
jgi:hypothetical protein